MTAAGGINDSLFLDIAFSPVCMDSVFMTPIHAKVASTEKYGDQYRLIVDLVPSEFLGPFERLRFKTPLRDKRLSQVLESDSEDSNAAPERD